MKNSQIGVYLPLAEFRNFQHAYESIYGKKGKNQAVADIVTQYLESPTPLETKNTCMKQFTTILPQQLKEDISGVAEGNGLPLTEVIRQLIVKFTKEVNDGSYQKPTQVIDSSGSKNAQSDWGEL